MAFVDTEQERTRLERVYADMTEGELQAIAKDGVSLTADAMQVLSAEIARRGLDIAVSTWHPKTRPSSQVEFSTRHGIVMLAIFAGAGVALILLVIHFPQWFSGCIRTLPKSWW